MDKETGHAIGILNERFADLDAQIETYRAKCKILIDQGDIEASLKVLTQVNNLVNLVRQHISEPPIGSAKQAVNSQEEAMTILDDPNLDISNLNNVILYIQKNSEKYRSRAVIAEEIGISESYLSRILGGYKPKSQIIERLVEWAKERLR